MIIIHYIRIKTKKDIKSFLSHKDHSEELISVFLAFSHTPVYTVVPLIRV